MNANERECMEKLIQQVIGAAYEVANELGSGFLEKVYERALAEELALRGLKAMLQAPVPVLYKGRRVGNYFADMLVEGKLLVELKCVDQFCPEHIAQCINYLRASGQHVALLFNFQRSRVEWKRVVQDY